MLERIVTTKKITVDMTSDAIEELEAAEAFYEDKYGEKADRSVLISRAVIEVLSKTREFQKWKKDRARGEKKVEKKEEVKPAPSQPSVNTGSFKTTG